MPVRLSRMERREKTRQDLLTAAEMCFVTRGFHATSVDDVAERAGYTKGAVYSTSPPRRTCFPGSTSGGSITCSPRWHQACAKSGQNAFDWFATDTIQRRDSDDGWLAVFFEFWAHVLRHPELRARFAACHARFLEPLTDGVRHLAEERGRALPSDVTPFQVVLAWNAMEVGLGLERLTHPPDVDMELARRMGWLLLDAILGAAPPAAQ